MGLSLEAMAENSNTPGQGIDGAAAAEPANPVSTDPNTPDANTSKARHDTLKQRNRNANAGRKAPRAQRVNAIRNMK